MNTDNTTTTPTTGTETGGTGQATHTAMQISTKLGTHHTATTHAANTVTTI